MPKTKGVSKERLEKAVNVLLVSKGYNYFDGNLSLRFALVTPAEVEEAMLSADGRVFSFAVDQKFRSAMGGSPGTIYEVPLVDESVVYTKAKVVGRWKGKQENRDWEAYSIGALASFDADQAGAKLAKESDLQPHLVVLRARYSRAVGSHKAQLLAYFVKEITRG